MLHFVPVTPFERVEWILSLLDRTLSLCWIFPTEHVQCLICEARGGEEKKNYALISTGGVNICSKTTGSHDSGRGAILLKP